MEGLRKSEKFMSEYKLSIFLTLAMLAMLFFTAGMKTDAAEVPNGLVVNNGVISYYENETVVKNTWKTVDGKKYYFQSNGKAAVGSVKVKKAYYVFNEAGILQTGKKRLVTVKNKQYYAAKNGKALSGIYYIKNKFYAFNKNGACNQKKTKKLKAAAKYNKNFKKLKKLLGKPKKTKYETYSCYGPGNDGYIKYANFTVYVYKYKGKVLYMGAE